MVLASMADVLNGYTPAKPLKYGFGGINDIIKTHGSESRGQEEAGLRDEPVSYLQVTPL